MQALQELSKEEAAKLSERIAGLSSMPLETKENTSYIALKIGDGPYSSVVTVRWSRHTVSFHIPSSNLENQAIAEGFSPENLHASRPFFKHKRYFKGLTLADLQKHEPLFRAIVKDSFEYVLSQRPKEK